MTKRKKHKRQFKVITFKVFYDTDEDILDWWEGIETGERSETLRDLIRDRAVGRQRPNQKRIPGPEAMPLMDLAKVRDDTTWIREALHAKFLYSSAFKVEIDRDASGWPTRIRLRGAGWGHGAGLCQIGALGMSVKGYACRDILRHYFEGVDLQALY